MISSIHLLFTHITPKMRTCNICDVIHECGTRHIVESMNTSGHHVNTLFLCGGLINNQLFVQTHADVTGKNNLIVFTSDAKYSLFDGLT